MAFQTRPHEAAGDVYWIVLYLIVFTLIPPLRTREDSSVLPAAFLAPGLTLPEQGAP